MDNSAKQTTHSVDSASSPQASSGQADSNSQLAVDTPEIKNDQATQPGAQAIKPVTTPVPNRGGIPVNPAPSQPVLSNTQADTQQASPVVSPRGKEQEPVPAPLPDVAKMTEAEIVNEEKEVEKELESIIEKSPDNEKPDIPKDVQQAGVTHAAEDTPVPATVSGAVSLPMSYDEAEFTHKKNKWKSSVSWFAALIMYHWKKIKITTSVVENKEE